LSDPRNDESGQTLEALCVPANDRRAIANAGINYGQGLRGDGVPSLSRIPLVVQNRWSSELNDFQEVGDLESLLIFTDQPQQITTQDFFLVFLRNIQVINFLDG